MKIIYVGVDEMDNAINELLNKIGARGTEGGADLDWNIEAIVPVREAVEGALESVYEIKVKYLDDSLCGDGGPMQFDDEKAVALTNEILAELKEEET